MSQQLTEKTICQPYDQVLHAAQVLSIKSVADDWSLPVQDEHAEGQHRSFQVNRLIRREHRTFQLRNVLDVSPHKDFGHPFMFWGPSS